MYTLDTNAIVYYLRGEAAAVAPIHEALETDASLFVSNITVGELLIFPRLTKEEEKGIRSFLSVCTLINVDSVIVERAAAIGRVYNVQLADAIIAATALYTNTELMTRNAKDFQRITELSVVRI